MRYGLRDLPEGANLQEMYAATRAAGFGAEVKRRILIGTYVLSAGFYDAYYTQAQKVRTLIARDFDRAWETCDLLLTPTVPTPAFKVGEKAADPLQLYLEDIFTIPANLAGLPAISVPCGKSGHLPVGFHLVGAPLAEAKLLAAARLFEDAHGFAHQQEIGRAHV